MAKRKRKRISRRRAAPVSAAPRRRRRRMSLMARPRGRKRRRAMSEGLDLVPAKMGGKYINPMLDGTVGGVAAQIGIDMVPDSLFTDNPSLKPHENWIKGLAMVGLGLLAVKMKQPLVAAGIAGGTAILVMQKEGILQDGAHGGFSARGRRSLRSARFADPALLSDASLLSDDENGVYDIYPPYDPLYESPKNEFRF